MRRSESPNSIIIMPFQNLFANIINVIETGATHGGYIFLFLISIAESIPFIGIAIPGHTAIIISGFLAKIGVFNVWIVIALASFGVIIGDMAGFYLGKKYGMPFMDRFKLRLFISDRHIIKARDLINRHTGMALIIGRLNPFTRSLMPFIVGVSHVRSIMFWVYNVIGGILWATASVMIGYVFGLGYYIFAQYIGKGVMIAVLVSIIIIWGYKFINARFNIFKKYELFALILNIVSLWALAKTVEDAWAMRSFMAQFDIWVNLFMNNLTHQITSALVGIAKFISLVGSTEVIIGIGILIGVLFIFKKRWRSAAIIIASICSTGIMVELMKTFFMRTRPENALLVLNDYSFPSGHAALAAVFFIVLIYLFTPKKSSGIKRELFITICVLAVITIGLSRIVLNVHWVSDVVAGWSLGVFCATAVILLVKYIGTMIIRDSN